MILAISTTSLHLTKISEARSRFAWVRISNNVLKVKKTKQHFRENDLTVEEIRTCKGFEHFTDEQAHEVIDVMKELTLMIFNFHRRNLRKPL
jgi:hypothetical protein